MTTALPSGSGAAVVCVLLPAAAPGVILALGRWWHAEGAAHSIGDAALMTVLAVVLGALGLSALVLHGPFPLWGWIAWAPDMLALTMLAAVRASVRMVPPCPTYRPFGS